MTRTIHLTRKAGRQLTMLPQMIQDLADLAIEDLEEKGVNPQWWI
ncbi:MAG: hypothetical protein RJQ07_04645 [Pseudomonadales bacterium]